MFRWLRKRRELVLAEADEFVESFGDAAYSEARYEARRARESGDWKREKFLSSVCRELAKRTGHEPGLDTATRYLDDQTPYVVDGPPFVRKRPDGTTLH